MNLANQTCQRKCRHDRDCLGRRQCLCDGACGLSCVIPGKDLSSPRPITYLLPPCQAGKRTHESWLPTLLFLCPQAGVAHGQ